jgi:hypothetical protein
MVRLGEVRLGVVGYGLISEVRRGMVWFGEVMCGNVE